MSSIKNIISPLSQSQKEHIAFFFPEGWAFFTKDPREEIMIDIYKIDSGKLNIVTISNSSFENGYGFSRKSRYINAETGKLLVFVGKDRWQEAIGWDKNKILPIEKQKVVVPTLKYFTKGEYLIVKYKMTPWAWLTMNQDKYNKYLLKRIVI